MQMSIGYEVCSIYQKGVVDWASLKGVMIAGGCVVDMRMKRKVMFPQTFISSSSEKQRAKPRAAEVS